MSGVQGGVFRDRTESKGVGVRSGVRVENVRCLW